MGRRYREEEAREEMIAAIEIGSTSFNDILKYQNISPAYPSYEEKKIKKGEITKTSVVQARGQDIAGKATWGKFLEFKGYINKSLIRLSKDSQRLAEEYYSFLVNDYAKISKYTTDRYQNLDMEGKRWLRGVVVLAVKHNLMQNKLAGYIEALKNPDDDEDYFCNDFALYYYVLVSKGIDTLMEHIIRQIQYLVKEPDKAEYYIDQIMNRHYEQLRQAPFPQRDNIIHLIAGQKKESDEGGLAAI